MRWASEAPSTCWPCLSCSWRRDGCADWTARLQVSRTAAFYSATLMLAGGYLLFMSAVGYYVRYVGGEWGRALQLALLAAGVAGPGRADGVGFGARLAAGVRGQALLQLPLRLPRRVAALHGHALGTHLAPGGGRTCRAWPGRHAGMPGGKPVDAATKATRHLSPVRALEHARGNRPRASRIGLLHLSSGAGLGHRPGRVPRHAAPVRWPLPCPPGCCRCRRPGWWCRCWRR